MRGDTRWLLVVLGVLALIVLLGPLLGGGMLGMMGGYGPGGMMGGYGPPGGVGWGWGLAMGLCGLAMLAFWGALIVGIVLLARWVRDTGHHDVPGSHDSALDILRRRYASGEITPEEFERMRQGLEQR